ncbi:MAG: YlmH/Sll1252 family protein [Dehalobacterium sp.]
MKSALDRDKCLSHIRDQALKQLMIRLLDWWEQAFFRQNREVTDFFDPYAQKIGEGILRGLSEMSFDFFGGYEAAERKRIAIFPNGEIVTPGDFRLAFLQVEGNFKFKEVNHRDYLGSLLGLGISRERIGDIIVGGDYCQVVLDQEIASYVIANWDKVNRVNVKVKEILPDELTIPIAEKKEIKSTVASPRLDAVIGIGFGCSRSKTLPDIKGGKVRVNWKTITDPSYQIKRGDHISYRGKGRITVENFSGPTQKGRFFVNINRYI